MITLRQSNIINLWKRFYNLAMCYFLKNWIPLVAYCIQLVITPFKIGILNIPFPDMLTIVFFVVGMIREFEWRRKVLHITIIFLISYSIVGDVNVNSIDVESSDRGFQRNNNLELHSGCPQDLI